VQVFSKFMGCNFQLAQRDFDDLFAIDQEAQTDLLPSYMAIQNNAAIAPVGTIETRQDMVRVFDAPAGKRLTGIVTLIGDRLYVACDDMTIHHGSLPSSGVGDLSDMITIDDQNNTYSGTTKYTYSGVVT